MTQEDTKGEEREWANETKGEGKRAKGRAKDGEREEREREAWGTSRDAKGSRAHFAGGHSLTDK